MPRRGREVPVIAPQAGAALRGQRAARERPPRPPGWPGPRPPGIPGPDPPGASAPAWPEPGGWPGRVYERLLEHRIVLAHGRLDGEAATRLCAQLLTLDAEGDDPIRLELHGLDAELPAALTVIGVLDVAGVPVHAFAGGQVSGPALGVLAACSHRRGYPNALLTLAEPRLQFDGSATELAARQQQLDTMADALYIRLAEATGRDSGQIRDDARQRRTLTAGQAVSYGLLHGLAEHR